MAAVVFRSAGSVHFAVERGLALAQRDERAVGDRRRGGSRNFVEDGTWQVAPASFGFGVTAPPTATVLPDMRRTTTPPNAGYTCIYLRHTSN